MDNSRWKATILSLFAVLFGSNTLAQPIGSGTSGGSVFGNWVLAKQLLAAAKPLFPFPIRNIPELAAFIVAIYGIYSLELRLTGYTFEIIEQRVKIGSGEHISLKSNKRSKGLKGFSFATAYLTIWMIGWAGFLVILGIGGIGLLVMFSSKFGLFSAERRGAQVTSARGEADVYKELKKIDKEMRDLKDKEDETEGEEAKGGKADPGKVEPGIELEVKEFEDIESKIETVESNMAKILNSFKNNENYVLREQKKEQMELGEVQNVEVGDFRDLNEFLKSLNGRLGQGDAPRRIVQDLQRQNKQLKELENAIRLEAEVHNNVNGLIKQLNGLKRSLTQLDKEIERLEAEERELEDEEKKAEQIDKQQHDKEDYERLKAAERETTKAKRELNRVISRRDELRRMINAELKKLEKEKRMDGQELREIKQILSELQEEGAVLEQIRAKISKIHHDNLSADPKKIVELIAQTERRIKTIESEAQKAL